MQTLETLADLLISERKKRNLSQRDMYMLIGMSQQQYQRIESGQDLKVSTLLRILAGLGLELFITDPEQMIQNQNTQSTSLDDDFWENQHKHLRD